MPCIFIKWNRQVRSDNLITDRGMTFAPHEKNVGRRSVISLHEFVKVGTDEVGVKGVV